MKKNARLAFAIVVVMLMSMFAAVSASAACAHNWVTTSTKAATCTAAGARYQKCTECLKTRTITLPKLGHNYVFQSHYSGQSNPEYITQTCSNFPNTSHSHYRDVFVAYDKYKCSRCGALDERNFSYTYGTWQCANIG